MGQRVFRLWQYKRVTVLRSSIYPLIFFDQKRCGPRDRCVEAWKRVYTHGKAVMHRGYSRISENANIKNKAVRFTKGAGKLAGGTVVSFGVWKGLEKGEAGVRAAAVNPQKVAKQASEQAWLNILHTQYRARMWSIDLQVTKGYCRMKSRASKKTSWRTIF
jgi:hypothetical protein